MGKNLLTELSHAFSCEDALYVHQLIRQGAPVNVPIDEDGNTALHLIAKHNFKYVLQPLLVPIVLADWQIQNHKNESPLLVAAMANRWDIVESVSKALPVAAGFGLEQCLYQAVKVYSKDRRDLQRALLTLVKHGVADLPYHDARGETVFHLAVFSRNERVFELLLAYVTDTKTVLSQKNTQGETPLTVSGGDRKPFLEIVKKLSTRHRYFHEVSTLQQAVRAGAAKAEAPSLANMPLEILEKIIGLLGVTREESLIIAAKVDRLRVHCLLSLMRNAFSRLDTAIDRSQFESDFYDVITPILYSEVLPLEEKRRYCQNVSMKLVSLLDFFSAVGVLAVPSAASPECFKASQRAVYNMRLCGFQFAKDFHDANFQQFREQVTQNLVDCLKNNPGDYRLSNWTLLTILSHLIKLESRLQHHYTVTDTPHWSTRLFDEMSSLGAFAALLTTDMPDSEGEAALQGMQHRLRTLREYSKKLTDFKKKIEELQQRGHHQAAAVAAHLQKTLLHLGLDYVLDNSENSVNSLQTSVKAAVEKAKPVLSQHRDPYKWLLLNIVVTIASLGTNLLIRQVYTSGKQWWFFGETKTQRAVDGLVESVCANSASCAPASPQA